MTGKAISPESSTGQIYNLEGVPSYDADDGEYDIEEFVDNDAATIDHHGQEEEQADGSEDSTRKPSLDGDERIKSMWSVRFLICQSIPSTIQTGCVEIGILCIF